MADHAHDVYLIPGFFGFANLGRLTYFGHVRDLLARLCAAQGMEARIHVVKTSPTASLLRRSARIVEAIEATTPRRRGPVHLIGHSSGGLDARLLAAPGVVLPTDRDLERVVSRLRTVVTVATPHYGTPLASFFASRLGEQVLRVLSLSTVFLLRFGQLPLRGLLQLGGIFSRVDDLAVNSLLLDQLFVLLLRRFSVGRRRAVQALFREVAKDQALLVQLTPEAMELFNATTRDRPGVRYGSVVTCARSPGIGSMLATGLDPSGQAMNAVYRALYGLAARNGPRSASSLSPAQRRVLRRAYGALPDARANDGIVPTRSQPWGEVIHAACADHLDVIGHFHDPTCAPPHIDWLTTGSGFTRPAFEAVWTDVVACIRG